MLDTGARASARERNRELFEGAFGAVYSFYIERERLSRLIAMIVWGGDIRPFHKSMRAIGDVPEDQVIVDCPCGSGVAFKALDAGQRVRYVALDLSPRMLERARRSVARRGLRQVELLEADAQAIPVEDASVDLFLSYWGLHCFPEPARAVEEIARCLRPGGRVVGAMITRGSTLRHRILVRPGTGGFGPGGGEDDLRGWLAATGFERIDVESSGLFTYFRAARPGRSTRLG